jgi:hypothetical protein
MRDFVGLQNMDEVATTVMKSTSFTLSLINESLFSGQLTLAPYQGSSRTSWLRLRLDYTCITRLRELAHI